MLRRIILLLISLLTIGGLFYWYFVMTRLTPEKAMASTVPLFVSVANLEQLKTDQLGQFLDVLPPASGLANQQVLLNWLEELLPDSTLRSKQAGVMGWQTSGGAVSSILVFDTKGTHREVKQKIADYTRQTANFHDHSIHTLKKDSLPSVAAGIYHNLVIVANLPLLVEEALDQLDRPDPDSRKWLWQHTDEEALEVYLRTDYLGQLYKESLSEVGKRQMESWRQVFGRLKVRITQDSLWEGELTPVTQQHFLPGMAGQGRLSPNNLPAVVPANALYSFLFNLDDASHFLSHYNTEFRAFMQSWIGTTGAFVQMSPINGNPGTGMAVVFEVADEPALVGKVDEWENRVGGLETYSYGMFEIRQLLDQQLLQYLLPGQRGNLSLVMLDKAVILANNPRTLERFLDQILVGNTLANKPELLQGAEGSAKLLINTHRFRYLLGTLLNDQRILRGLEQFGVGAFDFKMDNESIDFQGKWQSATPEMDRAETEVIWRTRLDAPAASVPCYLPGMDLIFIQDSSRQINALDRSGHLRWSKKLDGWLLSDLQEVNYFQDGASQVLFNTNGSIYLLDKLGNAVGSYPLRLQAPALNGVTVVDFDGNGAYKLFVAGTNGQFYGFDKDGGPIIGWNPHPMVFDRPTYPLQHAQYQHKDYLLAADQAGRLLVFGKNGDARFPVVELGKKPGGAPDYQINQGENIPGMDRMVLADENGQVLVLNPEGQSFKLALQVGKNRDVSFHFADITGDARKDYLVTSGGDVALYYYDENGFIKQFETTFPQVPDATFPVPFPGSKKSLVGASYDPGGQIYLLNEKGEMYSGFPLAGTTPFTVIGGTGGPILLVGNRGEVYAYRLTATPN